MKIGRKIGALVDYAGQQKIVFKGDRLDCFLITSISMEGIVLKKGKKEITLFLKEKVSST